MMTFIEEYHEELDVMVPIPELALKAGETMEEFSTRERGNISRAIAAAIELIVKFDVETMPCFAIKDTDVIFNTNRAEAVYSVDQCIQYFSEIEDYEKCARLLNLKSKL
jgi:hypothetical protein